MATGAGLVHVGTCLGVSCASSSSQNRASGSGGHQSVSLPYVKVDASGMRFRERPGLLRAEEVKGLITPVVAAGAASRRFDASEEPSVSDWETGELTDENVPQSWDKQEISSEAGAIVLSSSSTSLQSLSKDVAMGIVFRAAGSTAGWTTGSGLEGPAYSMEAAANEMPTPIFSKSPRRRMRVAFTCNVCGHRSIRAINPRAYTDGTVFVQCEGCDVYHKLVDNLKLFHELKGRVYRGYECFEVGYDQYYDFLG